VRERYGAAGFYGDDAEASGIRGGNDGEIAGEIDGG
jgi:hypothetical protein